MGGSQDGVEVAEKGSGEESRRARGHLAASAGGLKNEEDCEGKTDNEHEENDIKADGEDES
jgi:hypothetical protein